MAFPGQSSSSAISTPGRAHSIRQSDNDKGPYSIIESKDEDGYDRTTVNTPLRKEQWKSVDEQYKQRLSASAASQARRNCSKLLKNWWPEITACIMSLAVLLALFATLYVYVDRPSPQWPEWISINTIVSLYIVLLKACVVLVMANGLGQLKWVWLSGPPDRQLSDLVVYDDASRGALGALSLLWKLKFSQVLASLGALVTVLALATEPFAQQIIHYSDCSVPIVQATASIPRTSYYFEDGGLTGGMFETVVAGVADAINAGVLSPSSTPANIHCPTGNCTWPTQYSSMGWCSSCTDITNQLSFKNVTWFYHYNVDGENGTDTYKNLTSSLPGGLQVDLTLGDDVWGYAAMGAGPGGIEFILGQVPGGPLDPTTNLPWPECDTATNKQTSWLCQGYGASQCSLSPCVKTYTASITNGTLTESVVSTADQLGYGYNYLSMVDTFCVSAEDRQKLQNDGYDLNNGDRWLAYNITFDFGWPLPDHYPQAMLKGGCTYLVELGFVLAIGQYLNDYFSGQITGGAIGEPTTTALKFSGPLSVQNVFNFGNVTFERVQDIFTNISTSLTNYMRANGQEHYSTAASGIVYQDKVCIRVHWAWLALPTVLVLATWLFLIVVILGGRADGGGPDIWKSSPLPLIYRGLLHDDGASKGKCDPMIEDMQRQASKTRVKLTNIGSEDVRLVIQHVDGDEYD